MLRLCLLLVVAAAATFDDYDDGEPSLLKCNWAQAYDDFNELLNCAELQDEVMLLASHWEGRFAATMQVPYDSKYGSLTLDATVYHDSGEEVRHGSLLKLRYEHNNVDQQILITGFN
jgi:hypothetical protein